MALDTALRRGALIGLLPPPDGTIEEADRWAFLGLEFYDTPEVIYTPTLRELSSSEFLSLGKYRVEDWQLSNRLSLSLRDWQTKLEVTVPANTYRLVDLPNLDPNKYDAPIPLVYGKVYGIPAVQIDMETKTFQVADNALLTFDGFYADGAPITVDSYNTSAATFVWSAWDGHALTVDCTGILGDPIFPIADLLMTYGGLPASQLLTPTSFGDPNAYKGWGAYGAWNYYLYMPAISLYIADTTPIIDVIRRMVEAAFTRFWYNPAGPYYTIDSWAPVPGATVSMAFAEHEIFDLIPSIFTSEIVTAVTVKYAKNERTGVFQTVRVESSERQHLRNFSTHREVVKELPFYRARDAQWWASRVLAMEGQPLTTYSVKVSQRGWLCRPGDQVQLIYPKRGIDGIFEVLAVQATPGQNSVMLTVGDNRGYKDRSGFWVGDSPTFPASLGGGSCASWDASWTAAQKAWARRNIGYWLDDNSFADGSDIESYRGSVWV